MTALLKRLLPFACGMVLASSLSAAVAPDFMAKLTAESRPLEDRVRDGARRPYQVMQLLGVDAGMTLLDVGAGGGWFTRVLSAATGPSGKVIAQFGPRALQRENGQAEKNLAASLGNTEAFFGNISELPSFVPAPDGFGPRDEGPAIDPRGGNVLLIVAIVGLALAVVHPAAGHIGGGGFMIVFTRDGEVTTFDFREKAPLAATRNMYTDSTGTLIEDLNHEGYLAIGVPGTVAGFDLALKRFGTRSWKELAAPAVDLAEPSETNSGRYWYNLHIVLVTADRAPFVAESYLALIRDRSFEIAAENGHRIATLSVMPDRGVERIWRGR